jgi:GNAT superfamily N-acetyltransferase
MSEVAVRTARADDDHALRALRSRWTEEWGLGAADDDPDFAERFSSWLSHESRSRRFWLASARNRPVGMVNLLVVRRMPRPGQPDRAWGYIGNLFVIPERRRQGVASRLVDAVVEEATRDGLVHVLLHPNEGSLPFWRSRGFRPAGDFLVHEVT